MAEKKKTEQKKAEQEQEDNGRKKKKKSKVWKRVKLAFQVFLLLCMITVLIAVLVLYFKYGKSIMALQEQANALVAQSSEETFRQSETTLIYYNDGSRMAKLRGEKDTYYLDYEEIPQMAVKAMMSIEDKKFLKHNGIDLKGALRAGISVLKSRRYSQGGSTITMQLGKLVFLSSEKSMERKIKQMYVAVALEKKYDKSQIMEFYLNNAYFMNGYYGIQAAAKGYFGKNAVDLDLSQIAFLCAIPNSPTYYDPLEHKDHTLERRNTILEEMKEDGYISESECAAAEAEEITVKEPKASGRKKPYETFVVECAIKALMKANGFEFENEFKNAQDEEDYNKDYEENYNQCKQMLYNKGYRIYTSISKKKQKKLQKQVNLQLSGNKEKTDKIYDFQGSAVCIDNKNGRVVAIVGGRSQKILTGTELNRAYQSFRQPGSSIKPLVVYTPMFERGDYTLSSIVEDEPFEGGPRNSSGTYSGSITVRYAIEQSKNTIAWKLFEELTPAKGLQYLLDMNFKKIVEDDYGAASALGGLTHGASALEMTSAYAALENDGKYREPTCIVRITDSDRREIVPEDVEEVRVYKKDAARMMTDAMEGVLTVGTAKGHSLSATASAGKTGTTNDKKDGWFIGYTRYYTTGVWVGCDMPKAMGDLSGATYPLSIWYNFMEDIHSGKEWKDFEPYENKENEDDSWDDDGRYDDETDIYDDGDYEPVPDEPEETEPPETTFEPIPDEPDIIDEEDVPEDLDEPENEEPEDEGPDEPGTEGNNDDSDDDDEYEETPEVTVDGDNFGEDPDYEAGIVTEPQDSEDVPVSGDDTDVENDTGVE